MTTRHRGRVPAIREPTASNAPDIEGEPGGDPEDSTSSVARRHASRSDSPAGSARCDVTTAWHHDGMGRVYGKIDDRLRMWMLAQPVFFVATAPLAHDGHVNASPKGMAGTFSVLDEHRVAYLDYTGSGAETIAHVRENGRIVVMFCAFDGKPDVVRLHGRGHVVLEGDVGFAEMRQQFPKERTAGQRAIVVIDVERIADSCGYSVPLMDFRRDRDVLDRAQERRSDAYFTEYRRARNAESIDGLPAVPLR